MARMLRQWKRREWFPILCIALCSQIGAHAQCGAQKNESSFAATYSAQESSRDRKAKGSQYDHMGLSFRDDGQSIKIAMTGHWWLQVPALPFSLSDLVILGTPHSARSYLSADQTGIYTEFLVDVADKLFAHSDTIVPSVVAIDRPGGVICYESGVSKSAFSRAFPKLGRNYLLFLKKHSIGGNYGLVTAYEISDTQVVALDRVGQFMVYDKWDKDRFLNIVRDEAGVRRIQE